MGVSGGLCPRIDLCGAAGGQWVADLMQASPTASSAPCGPKRPCQLLRGFLWSGGRLKVLGGVSEVLEDPKGCGMGDFRGALP